MRETADLEDLLEEDPLIATQQYCVISYILPDPAKNELDRPLMKFRGAFRTIDECKKRAKKISSMEENKYVMLNYVEVGKWGRLKTFEELINDKDVDIDYEDELMNEMMKGHRSQKEKVDTEERERQEYRKKQLTFDGTKEGQKYLNSLKESIVSVQDRLEKYKNDLKYNVENAVLVEKRIKYYKDLEEKMNALLTDTNSEIAKSELFRKQTVEESSQEITDLLNMKLAIEERIKQIDEAKTNVDNFSIESQIKLNQEQIENCTKTNDEIKQKIQDLRKSIKATEELVKERTLEEQHDSRKEALVHAAKEYSAANIKLGEIDDYEKSFET